MTWPNYKNHGYYNSGSFSQIFQKEMKKFMSKQNKGGNPKGAGQPTGERVHCTCCGKHHVGGFNSCKHKAKACKPCGEVGHLEAMCTHAMGKHPHASNDAATSEGVWNCIMCCKFLSASTKTCPTCKSKKPEADKKPFRLRPEQDKVLTDLVSGKFEVKDTAAMMKHRQDEAYLINLLEDIEQGRAPEKMKLTAKSNLDRIRAKSGKQFGADGVNAAGKRLQVVANTSNAIGTQFTQKVAALKEKEEKYLKLLEDVDSKFALQLQKEEEEYQLRRRAISESKDRAIDEWGKAVLSIRSEMQEIEEAYKEEKDQFMAASRELGIAAPPAKPETSLDSKSLTPQIMTSEAIIEAAQKHKLTQGIDPNILVKFVQDFASYQCAAAATEAAAAAEQQQQQKAADAAATAATRQVLQPPVQAEGTASAPAPHAQNDPAGSWTKVGKNGKKEVAEARITKIKAKQEAEGEEGPGASKKKQALA